MNLKPIFSLFIISCFLTALPHADGQDKSNPWPPAKFPHDPNNCFHLLSNSYQCDWIFYGLKSAVEGTVVAYDTISATKKGPAAACVTMIKAGNDTVRVLHFTLAKHKPGDKIKITQAREPEQDVLVPFDRNFFINEESKTGKPLRINEYDARIRKTTWGNIVAQSVPATKKPIVANKPSPKK